MNDVSIIIPVYKDDAELSALLTALAPLETADIIISDGEVRAPPTRILEQFKTRNIRWLNAPKGRGAQIAAGLDVATTSLVWVLHADSRPEPGSLKEIKRLLSDPTVTLACFPLSFRSRSLSLKFFSLASRLDSAFTTFGDQGFAFRRKDYLESKLNLAAFPLLEDTALRRALRLKGRVLKSSLRLSTSARRFKRLGIWRTQIRNFGILVSYWRGVPPAKLYTRYYGFNPQTAQASLRSWPERQASTQARAAGRKTAND